MTARPRLVQTEDATGVPFARHVPDRVLVAEVEQLELHALHPPQLTVRLDPAWQPEKSSTVRLVPGLPPPQFPSATVTPSLRRQVTLRVCLSFGVHDAPGSCQPPVTQLYPHPEYTACVWDVAGFVPALQFELPTVVPSLRRQVTVCVRVAFEEQVLFQLPNPLSTQL